MKKRIKPRLEKIKRKKEIIFIVCGCSMIIFLASLFLLRPHIILKKNTIMETNIYDEYKDPGYKALYLGQDVSKDVKIKNKININKQGIYEITYSLKKGLFKTKVKRKVKVSDLKAPEIVLTGDKNTYICPNSTYKEEGYSAIDNVDKNITKNVKINKHKNEIIYTVADKAGNKISVKRKIIEEDKTPPEIKLNGDEIHFIHVNQEYEEKGYQAIDNCDGNITEKVKVTGNINTKEVGDYELIYEVSDKNNNKTMVKRKIKVVNAGGPGTIYLTFDDGPKRGTTDAILDILKEENIKATFFVTASGPDDLIKRQKEEGHSIGLHTASHNYALVYASSDSYFNDLQAVHDRVYNLTGIDSRIIRFPGGSSNTISRKYNSGIMSYLSQEVLKRGYQYYDWNISSGDAEGLNSQQIYQRVTTSLSKEKVNMILMHDVKATTRDALKGIIQYAKENGYHFESINLHTEMVRQRINN